MTQWIVLIAVAAVILYAIVIFNRLVRTRALAEFFASVATVVECH